MCVWPNYYAALMPRNRGINLRPMPSETDTDEAVFDTSDSQNIVPTGRTNKSYMWIVIAVVLDRIFFVIYLAGVVVYTFTIVSAY